MSLALVLAACGGSDSTDSSDRSNSSGKEASSSEAPPSSAAAGGSGGDKNGGDKEAACTKIRQTFQQITTSGSGKFDDPDALAQIYFDGATAVEASGDESGDDEVRSAADRAASALRDLGEGAKARSTSIPDSGPLTKAGVDLQSACT